MHEARTTTNRPTGARFAAVEGVLLGGLMVTQALASEPSNASPSRGSSAEAAAETGSGVTSGGSGDCQSGGTTFFQPLTKAMTALGVKLAGQSPSSANPTAQAALPAPDASATQGAAIAPGSAAPGAVEQVGTGGTSETFLSRLTNPNNIGPGLLVIAGSLVTLVATRYIRTEQERNAYRRAYSGTWG